MSLTDSGLVTDMGDLRINGLFMASNDFEDVVLGRVFLPVCPVSYIF